jgi:hypothetical protein
VVDIGDREAIGWAGLDLFQYEVYCAFDIGAVLVAGSQKRKRRHSGVRYVISARLNVLSLP